MTVKEFYKYVSSPVMFHIVDATKQGYLSEPEKNVIYGGDINAIKPLYGDCEVVGFEPRTKKSIYLYIKPEVKESTYKGSISKCINEETKLKLYLVSYTTNNGDKVKDQLYTADHISKLLKDLEDWEATNIVIKSKETGDTKESTFIDSVLSHINEGRE